MDCAFGWNELKSRPIRYDVINDELSTGSNTNRIRSKQVINFGTPFLIHEDILYSWK